MKRRWKEAKIYFSDGKNYSVKLGMKTVMPTLRNALFWMTVCLLLTTSLLQGEVTLQKEEGRNTALFRLSNDKISYQIEIQDNHLIKELLESSPPWIAVTGTHPLQIKQDGNFLLDVMWTGWRAPGKLHNADNAALFSKKNFRLTGHESSDIARGGKELHLFFTGQDNTFEIRLSYQMEEGAFFVKRKLAVRDTTFGYHFLRWIWPVHGLVYGDTTILKEGGFGQPIAILKDKGGAFFGLEYPTAENHIRSEPSGPIRIKCGQEIGEKIVEDWVESEWAVTAIAPDPYVKLWFNRYMDHVRVAPLKPYLLYNTWYDVRSELYTEHPEDVMNEANLLKIIRDFKREMVEKRGFQLDAFVLDDGWDIYESDWKLRDKEFPGGLTPITEELRNINTVLGIWLGPTGGYSYRMKRIDWMKDHGYETMGEEINTNRAMLCLAGQNYKHLFKKRVVDFVKNEGVGYFKWDGIQFSCSEPDHAHPVGIYSRRAVMETVADLCQTARQINPDVFLNITSGTWLSPWWMKYANMIWMQGRDYGYSDIPSISRRDAAMTYRDVVLYQNYGINDSWTPISNLMTHGIIKGRLDKLSFETESLNKFTNNALLYFTRGVTMWELYISPHLLSEEEWDALAQSIRWAKSRFPILKRTEMIGGNPGKREPYGYAHFVDKHGIIALRNPSIQSLSISIGLLPSQGISPHATSLVLERVYPTRWISPKLHAAKDIIELSLDGYETAVYEVYPLEEAEVPLLAGVTFEALNASGTGYTIKVLESGENVRLLNPKSVKNLEEITIPEVKTPKLAHSVSLTTEESGINIRFNLQDDVTQATLAVLFEPKIASENEQETQFSVTLDTKPAEPQIEKQDGKWCWIKVPVNPGLRSVKITINGGEKKWTGSASAWLVCGWSPEAKEIKFDLTHRIGGNRPLPPAAYPSGILPKNILLGNASL